MSTEGTLEAIKAKISELGDKKRALESEMAALRSSEDKLRKELGEQKKLVDELTDKNKVLKVAKSLGDSDGKSTETKLKINELVREIDKCIALLNK